jgi:hypothetical protein
MSDVQYDSGGEEFARPFQTPEQKASWTDSLVAKGFVRDRAHAEYVLIGVCIVAIVVAFLFFRFTGGALEGTDISRLVAPPPGAKTMPR